MSQNKPRSVEDIFYAHNNRIKSLHHSFEYKNLSLTPDEILDREDTETSKALNELYEFLVSEAVTFRETNMTSGATVTKALPLESINRLFGKGK